MNTNPLKNALLLVPAVKRYVDHVHQLRAAVAAQQHELSRLNNIVDKSRSPGLFKSTEELLTDRLLAHPAKDPLPSAKLSSQGAIDNPNRVLVADRLITSYHRALENEERSPLKREGEDLWSSLIRNELPELMDTIERRHPESLARYLMNFGKSFVWFGGITTCVDGYNRNPDPQQIALTYLDKLVCLGELLGILPFEGPEHGPWGENLHTDVDQLLERIENEIGIEIAPPLGVIHTDGLQTGKGLFHYRHINALYSAIRLAKLNQDNAPVCEFGGGLGITSLYAHRMGILNYTLFDLPITCLLAGHYLIHAVGENFVSLYGEASSEDSIKILPYWECLNIPDKKFGLTLNQDSLPEIADNLAFEYLNQIKRLTKAYFLSINHEGTYPRTVGNFVKSVGGYEQIYRSKCWVREGYLEEAYRIITP
jgi:hypothetical protein